MMFKPVVLFMTFLFAVMPTVSVANFSLWHQPPKAVLAKPTIVKEKKSNEGAGLTLIETKVSHLQQSLHRLSERLAQQKIDLAALQKKRQQWMKTAQVDHHALRAQLRAYYIASRVSPWKILLDDKPVNTLSRYAHYHRYLIESDAQALKNVSAHLRQLHQMEQKIQQLHLQTTQGLIAKKAQQQRLLLEVNQRLQILKKRRHHRPVDERVTDVFGMEKGRLPWPVSGGFIHHYHHAVLLDPSDGRAVKAIYPGHVVFANRLRGLSLLLVIDHGQGYFSLYGHNQRLYAAKGDYVKQGALIATTAKTSGDHHRQAVYFSLRHHGHFLNPETWCRARN